ncbi:MAG: glycosyltransferase family 2 protein, partial [Chloroflexia bacterium]
ERDNLAPLHRELTQVLRGLQKSYEILFIDDGSLDGSIEVLREIRLHDEHVRTIRLARNTGQTAALACGLHNAKGAIVTAIDADGENDPADIPRLIDKLDEGFELVSGWRTGRWMNSRFTRRIPSVAANSLISWMTGVKMHDYGCTLKAYRREVIDHIHLYGEMHRFIPAHAAWVGATITEIPVQHHPRLHGKSKYGLARTIKVVLDLLTVKFLGSYSTKPIYVFGGLGLSSISLSLVSLTLALLDKFVNGVSLIQSPLLLLAAMLFIIGVELILMGFLAEISVRTYHESQAKPTYVVRRVVRKESTED